jgi:acyl-CoA synthetase (AMP-forming)/AMP-acid ligase II
VHAVVVRAADQIADESELTGFCRARIAAYKIPRSFSFVTDLPLSAAGKVLKRKLREPYWSGAERQVQ